MIGACQCAAGYLSDRQLQVAVRAAVFQSTQRTVVTTKDGNRAVPKFYLDDASGRHARIIFDSIPMIRMKTGGAGAFALIPCRFKGRWPLQIRTIGHLPHY